MSSFGFGPLAPTPQQRAEAAESQVRQLEATLDAQKTLTRLAERVAEVRIAELETALMMIRDQDWVENTLDPQWAARIARDALKGKAGE